MEPGNVPVRGPAGVGSRFKQKNEKCSLYIHCNICTRTRTLTSTIPTAPPTRRGTRYHAMRVVIAVHASQPARQENFSVAFSGHDKNEGGFSN